ncbi:hypothetical protein ACFLVS_05935 [Chloroflexota bacterium]
MQSRKKNIPMPQKAPPVENNPMVITRLRTLLELAVTIGRREGLLGNNSDFNVEGGQDVADKGNICGCKSLPAGKD